MRRVELEKAKILFIMFPQCIAAAERDCTRGTMVTFQACRMNAPNPLKVIRQGLIRMLWEGLIPLCEQS